MEGEAVVGVGIRWKGSRSSTAVLVVVGGGEGSDGVDGRNAVGICMEEDGAEKEVHKGATMTLSLIHI